MPKNKQVTKSAYSRLPLVSVIMPAYNAEHYIELAVESIINQTYQNFELIVVNDASKDGTGVVLRRLAKHYPKKMRVIHLKKNVNRGGDGAGNIGFTYAKGDFIARMDADDIAHPERLERQVKYFLAHPKCAVLGTNAQIIDQNGEVIGQKLMPQSHKEIFAEYFSLHPMIHPTIMVRRSALLNKGQFYRTDLNSNNDYLTFFTMIVSGLQFHNLQEKLLKYRFHTTNDSLAHVKRTFKNVIWTRNDIVKNFGYKPTVIGWVKHYIQYAMAMALPEKVILWIYLLMRGMYSPAKVAERVRTLFVSTSLRFSTLFAQIAVK